MKLKRLKLVHFRNFSQCELELGDGASIFLGTNGSGKTNLLEAIYFLTNLSGFRAERDEELVQKGRRDFFLRGEFIAESGARLTAEVFFHRRKKYLRVNGVPVLRFGDWWGRAPLSLFSPARMELLWGEPARRRNLWDEEIARYSPEFRQALATYRTAWLSRNRILRTLSGRGDRSRSTERLYSFYTDSLILSGSRIVFERIAYLREVLKHLDGFYRQLTRERFRLRAHYASSIGELPREATLEEVKAAFAQRIKRVAVKERERGHTLVGPQRDDVRFFLGDVPIGSFGSQGQVRAATIALCLSLARIASDRSGEPPLLLLDDALSELDDERKLNLVKLASQYPQALITSASDREVRALSAQNPTVLKVEDGRVVQRQSAARSNDQ